METDLVSWGDRAGLWLLVAGIPCVLLVLWTIRKRREEISSSLDEKLWTLVIPDRSVSLMTWQNRGMAAVWILAVLALARPQWGFKTEATEWKGLDVVVALDVSNSMNTEDVIPSRMRRARKIGRALLDRIHGDRVGLVLFAGQAQLASPLTTDTDFVRETLDSVDSKWMVAQGTDLGKAMDMSRQALERGGESEPQKAQSGVKNRVVLVITDGEDLEKGAEAAADKLLENGIALLVVGVGTEAGAPIPIRDERGVLHGYKKDAKGEPVVSRMDRATLESIATRAKGKFWSAGNQEQEVAEVMSALDGFQRTDRKGNANSTPIERYRIPLSLACLVLFFTGFIPSHRRAVKKLVCLTLLSLNAWSPSAEAQSLDAYMENERGKKAFEQGDLDKAKQHFGTAHALEPKNDQIQFNEAVSQAAQGNLDESKRLFGNLKTEKNDLLKAKTLYNLGTLEEKKDSALGAEEAIRHWAQAAELFEKLGQPEAANQARRKINGNKPPPPQPPNPSPSPSPSPPPQGEQKQDPKENDHSKNDKREQKFKSKNLTPEDAKRVMNELSDREQQLKDRMERRKEKTQDKNRKDW